MNKYLIAGLGILVLVACSPVKTEQMNGNITNSATVNQNLNATVPPAKQDENQNNNYSRIKGEGEMCGGFAGFLCAEGLTCKMDGDYPDASGTCVPLSSAPGAKITNFEECAAAMHVVMESYPRQCRTPDGKTYTEVLSHPEQRISQLNELCGGFAVWQCAPGLECIYGPNGSSAGTCAKSNAQKGEMCAQVIALAKDPRTGECWSFPTPCDVPSNWTECSQNEPPKAEGSETGPQTVCKNDGDCWCRNFDGTKFLSEGTSPGVCDMQTMKCGTCYYK